MTPRRLKTAVLGVDVGGTHTKWATVEDQRIRDAGTLPTPDAPEALAAELHQVLSAGGPVDRVGVAVPAVIDQRTGTPLIPPNLPAAWTQRPVAAILAGALDRPVSVCNDARAFALAEATVGAGRTARTVACITLGTGVGGGVVVDGRPQVGRGALAGEFGHLLVRPGGQLCGCGARGCLEAYAGGRALVSAVRARGAIDLATPESIAIAAAAGDPLAGWAIRRAGEALGRALSMIAIVLAPDVVVIGGGLRGAYDLLRPHIEQALARASSIVPAIAIRPSQLGYHAGAIGAALWEKTS
jgi:glucokinase